MDDGIRLEVMERLRSHTGNIGFYYRNLVTGEELRYRDDEEMMAASVIKLYIMAAAFQLMHDGRLDGDRMVAVGKEDYVPSCGAIAYLHEGLLVTVMDLITLMIIFSDNTAANVLIEIMGMDEINRSVKNLGYEKALLRRKMYDLEKSRLGIQNRITAGETGRLLADLWQGRVVSRAASDKMLSIMKNQQVNGKIPFYLQALPEEPVIAHKTGEDTGITHDVGIVYGAEPFVVCFCGNETDTPAFERTMAEVSLMLYREQASSIHVTGEM